MCYSPAVFIGLDTNQIGIRKILFRFFFKKTKGVSNLIQSFIL